MSVARTIGQWGRRSFFVVCRILAGHAKRWPAPLTSARIGYAAVLVAAFTVALLVGWLATPFDNYAYDWMFRRRPVPPRAPEAILLAVDEASLEEMGGMRGFRPALAKALEQVAAARPSVVAIDSILADAGVPEEDAALEAALARIPRLVLPADIIDDGRRWEVPIERFGRHAAAIGHVHGDPGLDGISRLVPLEQVTQQHQRRWALALEAFRVSRGGGPITESPRDIEVGGITIPATRADQRAMLIRYLPPDRALPRVSFKQLADNPALAARFSGKVVFVGVTAQSAMRDRMLTPVSYPAYMSGVEIHANIFETLAGGKFLTAAPDSAVALACLLLALAGVAAFAFRSGWQAYALAGVTQAAAHTLPYALFTRDIVFPYVAPVSATWIAVIGAAGWHFVFVRRDLRKAEADRTRYQQAMHFVTHEMKTPLTAIQGSSELMTRFNLPEDKRKQIASMIHTESRRLAKMVETFLNVERLSAGQMELKREPFPLGELLTASLQRVAPLADRKQITVRRGEVPEATLTGDRELMEYAVYNLLNNAIKYSPAETRVTVSGRLESGSLRLAIQDQGIGMEEDEVKKVFQKFYRTSRAVASGESGTGIGLSIVDQIVTHHGGRIEVKSKPGQGSCFTLVLPVSAAVATGADS